MILTRRIQQTNEGIDQGATNGYSQDHVMTSAWYNSFKPLSTLSNHHLWGQEGSTHSRLRAREASLAAAGGNKADSINGDPNSEEHQSQDDLMEILEQGKTAISKTWVPRMTSILVPSGLLIATGYRFGPFPRRPLQACPEGLPRHLSVGNHQSFLVGTLNDCLCSILLQLCAPSER